MARLSEPARLRSASDGPAPRRRPNPGVRPSFAPVRLRAARGGARAGTASDRPADAPGGPAHPAPTEPKTRRRPNPSLPTERTRASPPSGPEPPRRPNPSVRLSFASVRLRAARGPTHAAARRRADPRSIAPSEPGRPPFVRYGATLCGSEPGMPGFGPPATGLTKNTLDYRESGPPRSPNPRRGEGPRPRPGRIGAGSPGRGRAGPDGFRNREIHPSSCPGRRQGIPDGRL